MAFLPSLRAAFGKLIGKDQKPQIKKLNHGHVSDNGAVSFLGSKPQVRRLKHGRVSDNGTVSFDLNDIKNSISDQDRAAMRRFIASEQRKNRFRR